MIIVAPNVKTDVFTDFGLRLLWKNCKQIDIILDMRRSNGIAEFGMDLELERNRVQMHLVSGAT